MYFLPEQVDSGHDFLSVKSRSNMSRAVLTIEQTRQMLAVSR